MTLLALIFAAVADTTGTDGLSLAIGGTLGAAIVGGLVKIYTSRKHAEETKIPQPCEVHKTHDCISVQECNRRMKDLDERVTRLETKFDAGFNRLADQLSEIERKSEERAVSLHRRLDKITEKTAETAGAVEMIKGKMFKRS